MLRQCLYLDVKWVPRVPVISELHIGLLYLNIAIMCLNRGLMCLHIGSKSDLCTSTWAYVPLHRVPNRPMYLNLGLCTSTKGPKPAYAPQLRPCVPLLKPSRLACVQSLSNPAASTTKALSSSSCGLVRRRTADQYIDI